MSPRLTKAQREALGVIAGQPGYYPKRGWRAMRSKLYEMGLVEVSHFDGCLQYRLTPAGRALLKALESGQ